MNLFPLTRDQLDLFRYAGSAPASLLNMPLYVEIEDDIDEELFVKAVYTSIERLPYVRVRLHDMPDGSTEQYISEMDEQEHFDWQDCTKWSENKLNNQLFKWSGTAFPNKQRDTQLYRIKLLRLKDGKHGFYFCGYHLIIDIYAATYFVIYLDSVYYALLTGTELPRLGASPETVVKDRIAYFNSEKYKRDYDWWVNEYSVEPNFTTLNGVGAPELIEGKRYGRERSMLQLKANEKIYTLSPELDNLINSCCLKMNMSPNIAYCLALRTFMATVCETDEASIQVAICIRTKLDQKSSGLTRASSPGFITKVTSDMTFEEAMKETYRADCEYLKHASVPSTYIPKNMYGVVEGFTYQPIIFSYVPFVDYNKFHLNVKARKIDSGIALKPAYILAMHLGKNQPLSLVYQYSVGYYKESVIDRCENFLEKFLEKGFNNPQMKIGDISKECL